MRLGSAFAVAALAAAAVAAQCIGAPVFAWALLFLILIAIIVDYPLRG